MIWKNKENFKINVSKFQGCESLFRCVWRLNWRVKDIFICLTWMILCERRERWTSLVLMKESNLRREIPMKSLFFLYRQPELGKKDIFPFFFLPWIGTHSKTVLICRKHYFEFHEVIFEKPKECMEHGPRKNTYIDA